MSTLLSTTEVTLPLRNVVSVHIHTVTGNIPTLSSYLESVRKKVVEYAFKNAGWSVTLAEFAVETRVSIIKINLELERLSKLEENQTSLDPDSVQALVDDMSSVLDKVFALNQQQRLKGLPTVDILPLLDVNCINMN